MLRKPLRPPKPPDLRRLFDTLKALRSNRLGPLTELTPPTAATNYAVAPHKQWPSLSAMQAADVTSDDEPRLRVFEQVVRPPPLLKQPLSSVQRDTPTTGIDSLAAPPEGAHTRRFWMKGLSKADVHRLRKLTTALGAFMHSPLSVAKEVFYWLEQFQDNPTVLQLLTPHAWTILWALEVEKIPTHRSVLIGEMMKRANVPMTDEQEVGYIGGLFWHDKRAEAISRWKEKTREKNASPELWNLGLRMLALDKKPYVAEHWLGVMKGRLGSRAHPRSWIPIVMGYNHIYQPQNAHRVYTEMRKWAAHTKQPLTADNYDTISMSFLDADAPLYGLEVYKHMVYSVPSAFERLNTNIYAHLSPTVRAVQGSVDSPETLNSLSLDALKLLPPKVADKYFYSSWLDNLNRIGRPDLSWYLVRSVMAAHNHTPDSRHLDTIIAGLLPKDPTLAFSIASEMITARINLTTTPAPDWTSTAAATVPTTPPPQPPKLPPGPTAPATIHTFSLLIHHQARRQRTDAVIALSQLMAKCNISPNAHIYNHLLYSLLRISDLPRLARTFSTLLASSSAKPDLETWHIIWYAQWHRHTQKRRRFSEFPGNRELFAEMVRHFPKSGFRAGGEMASGVWRTAVRCFLKSGDLPGVLVALQAGKAVWGVSVDRAVVKEVVFGVLKTRSREVAGEMVEGGVGEVGVLGGRLARRRKGGWRRVRDPEGLLEGVTLMLRREMGETGAVGEMVESAKREMGVEGLRIE